MHDTLPHLKNKNEMFTVINEYHIVFRNASVKTVTDKTFFFLKKVSFSWSRYISRRNPTDCETSKTHEELEVTWQ